MLDSFREGDAVGLSRSLEELWAELPSSSTGVTSILLLGRNWCKKSTQIRGIEIDGEREKEREREREREREKQTQRTIGEYIERLRKREEARDKESKRN